jgi:hypothetical protein
MSENFELRDLIGRDALGGLVRSAIFLEKSSSSPEDVGGRSQIAQSIRLAERPSHIAVTARTYRKLV